MNKFGIFFQDYTQEPPVWEYTDDANYVQANLCLQEILLWRGEVAFNIDLGIDYEGVFNSSNFVSTQLEDIIDKYRKFFRDITYTLSIENEIVIINLNFVFFGGGAFNGKLKLNHIDGGIYVSNQ